MSKTTILAALAAAVLFAAPALAEGDAAKGEKVFAKCKACHEVEKGVNKVGPTLKGVVGRKAGLGRGLSSIPKPWPPRARKAWCGTRRRSPPTCRTPRPIVPKTKMAFAGLKKPEEIADVIAYLKAHP
jgi:cytochrome c